ncbi:MAG: tRNA (cytidine(34)-2'-O)-methyltransferase, partial [Candidatus Puniceispirillaceae bacterium]
MFDLVLHQPQIPPNTGNIIRLCANSGANLHLIEPLGFRLDEKSCRRAGLDYKELAKVKSWPDFDKYKNQKKSGKIWLVTKYGESCYSQN